MSFFPAAAVCKNKKREFCKTKNAFINICVPCVLLYVGHCVFFCALPFVECSSRFTHPNHVIHSLSVTQDGTRSRSAPPFTVVEEHDTARTHKTHTCRYEPRVQFTSTTKPRGKSDITPSLFLRSCPSRQTMRLKG